MSLYSMTDSLNLSSSEAPEAHREESSFISWIMELSVRLWFLGQ